MACPSVILLVAVSVAFFDFGKGFDTSDAPRISNLYVSTPEEYERLIPGGEPAWRVTINASAHPNVLGEAKRWASSSFEEITFNDKYNNVISLQPIYRKVIATFKHGTNLLAYLPTEYKHYNVRVGKNVITTVDDIKAIEQWQTAKELEFYDENDFTEKLVEHADLLKQNERMESLALIVERHSLEQLAVKTLFDNLTGLRRLGLGIRNSSGLTEDDLRAFNQQQNIPDDFDVKFYDGSHDIAYTKRSGTQSLY